jgi:phage terminase large subunit
LKRYRRQENNRTGEFGAPIHDQYSHSADAFRYLGVNAESLTNEERKPVQVAERRTEYDYGAGY